MRILVSGASGFIGTRLIQHLNADSAYQVFSIVHSGSASEQVFVGDVGEEIFLADVLQAVEPDCIIHLAANRSRTADFGEVRKALLENVLPMSNILDRIAQRERPIRLVVLGTAEEYGNGKTPSSEEQREHPVSGYSFSKVCMAHLCELFSRTTGNPVCYLRPSLCYGPGQALDMFIPSLIDALVAGREFLMTPGGQKRDFLYVDDVIEAIRLAAIRTQEGFLLANIGSGESLEIGEVARLVARQLGAESLLRMSALPYRKNEIMNYRVEVSIAFKQLGWYARMPLGEGIGRTIEFFRARA